MYLLYSLNMMNAFFFRFTINLYNTPDRNHQILDTTPRPQRIISTGQMTGIYRTDTTAKKGDKVQVSNSDGVPQMSEVIGSVLLGGYLFINYGHTHGTNK